LAQFSNTIFTYIISKNDLLFSGVAEK